MNGSAKSVVLCAALMVSGGTPTNAATLTLRELLAQGYEIKATEVIPSEVARRMSGSQEWGDDLLITLQKNADIALCHSLLSATINFESFLDLQCFTPK